MDVPPAERAVSSRALSKVTWRLIPFLIFLYILNYLDRANLSFAKLGMNADLGFNDEIYGRGAGIFFLGYFAFEIPSNLIMARVGARVWIARIMFTWGLIAVAMMFVKGTTSFFSLRFLLGLAEAGFFPGTLLYLTYWVPGEVRARALAWFLTSTALSNVIGMPLAGALMQLEGTGGLRGWQWIFLLEGLPTVLAGFVVLRWLKDGPAQATWLADDERQWLTQRMETERAERARQGHHELRHAFTTWRAWHLCLIYFCLMFGFQSFIFWLPTVLKEITGLAPQQLGWVAATPYLAAAPLMVLVGRHSDHTGERRWHVWGATACGAAGLVLCACTTSPWIAVPGLVVAAAGIWSALGPFWALPPLFLSGPAAVAGLALINSVGNLAGYAGNELFGRLKEHLSYRAGLGGMAGALLLAGLLTLALRPQTAERRIP